MLRPCDTEKVILEDGPHSGWIGEVPLGTSFIRLSDLLANVAWETWKGGEVEYFRTEEIAPGGAAIFRPRPVSGGTI